MSASSGIIAKGERGKSKFQSLDINNLYKATETEPTQQKGNLLRTKNGMQSLGKVPTARRPPANLPSLKAESSGNEPAVSLVPAGAAGWGSKPGEGPPPPQQTNAPAVSNSTPAPPPAPVAVVAPVVMVPPSHEQALHNLMAGSEKSWSAIMAREQVPNFLAHQSPQFQHEFPKLASEGGPGAPVKPIDAQYGPGPSLRPQTEGSWTAGGGRPPPGALPGPSPPSLVPGLHGSSGPEPGGVRTNLGPHPAAGAPMGPAGPGSMPINYPGSYRPLQHPFMMQQRPGNFPPNMAGMRPRFPGMGYPHDARFPSNRTSQEGEEPVTRPIIRDEELNKMDEIARDPGWAANEDIDYNQQLAFSDNEEGTEDSNKKDFRKDRSEKGRAKDDEKEKGEIDRRSEERGNEKRGGDWDRNRHRPYQNASDDERRKLREAEDERERRKKREVEDERKKYEEDRQKVMEEERRKIREEDETRRKFREDLANACQVARQRKEDEVKRFDEPKRYDKRDNRDWDDRGLKRDHSDRDIKREEGRDQKRDGDHPKNDRDSKRETENVKGADNKRDNDHGKYKRDNNERESKRDEREAEPGKFEWDNKRDGEHGKYEREAKRDNDHGKYDKRENDHKYERDSKRDENHGKYDRDFRNRQDDRRDYRQGPRTQHKLAPRFQAQADRMNSQHRSTGSPQPAATNQQASNNFDGSWGHGRRYGNDNGDEARDRDRDRHTPDTYSDRYKGGANNREQQRYNQPQDRHSFSEADHRRHADRKDKENESERLSEDSYKKTRETDSTTRSDKEDRKEASEEREVWRGPVRDEREDERRPQRPDSRDSRTSRDSRNSREDKHDSDHKTRVFPSQVKEEKRREEMEIKATQRQVQTPPRENIDSDKKQHSRANIRDEIPSKDVTHKNEPSSLATNDENKDDKEKSPAVDDNRLKGGKAGRGGRWNSNSGSNSSTYVRNGIRNDPRRRRVSGGAWNRPENESGSSGEGGSELDKGDKDDRNKETRRSGEGLTTRDGFAPSGQPSRRGRGATRVRGGSTSAPKRIDGYGPPPVKASFPHNEPTPPEEEEDRTKQKQAALNAGIAGTATRTAAPRSTAPRMQRTQSTREPNRPKPNRAPRRTGKGGDGDEAWETMSNSDVEEKKIDGRGGGGRRGGASRPPGVRSSNRAPGSGAPGSFTNKPIVVNADIKEEKPVEASKAKIVDGETDTPQSNAQDNRGKKSKEGFKGKTDGGGGGGGGSLRGIGNSGKDRTDRQDRQDRRGKVPNPIIVAPNPNGPQPLMSQVVNPPASMKNYSGGSTWRSIPLPPRLQKQQDQQRQIASENHEINKPVSSMFPPKGETMPARENAWEKPLAPPSRSPADQGASETSSQRSSPGNKLAARNDALLDDSTPPVNTIIFENTNLKSAPGGFSTNVVKQPHRLTKGNEWKPGEELFGKNELVSEPLSDHSIKPPLYRAESGIEMDLLNTELEMTEENAADLKHRLAGTKTLWDQNEDEQAGSSVFPATFCQDTSMDPSGFGKPVDGVVVPDDCIMHTAEVVYSPVPQGYGMSKHDPSTTSNVCKVKPQQQAVVSSGHSPLGHAGQSPLSPPPYNTTQGQFNYQQAGLGNSGAQFGGMPAIPSPPAGLPYSSQPLQPSGGLFTQFPLERSQFSTQFSAPYGISAGLGGTSTFNQPPLYLSSHPGQPQDFLSSMSQYRVQHPSPHTNPNTVLLTSSTNSLMSASVKPSSQNIGVIGSKGPTYQQSNQMFIPFEAMQLGVNQSYMSGSGMVQRSAPIQPAAPNFYSNTPNAQTGFYSNPNSGLGQPMPNLQQPYARQGFVGQSATHNLQSYSSQVHLEMGYRNPGTGPSYLKPGVGNNSVNQDVMAAVFSSGPPKTRPPKQVNQPPPQQSPTQSSVNKFGNYSNSAQLGVQQQPPVNQQRVQQANLNLQNMRSTQRYPTPIQRPMPYRGRPGPQSQQRPSSKPYYEAQDGKLEEVSDLSKAEEVTQLNCESKLPESVDPGKTDGGDDDVPSVKE